MRSGFVVLLLGAWCLGAEPRLKDLFDPGSPRFPLTPYGWEEWDKLPRKAKMRSKGVDPATWSDPPPDPPDPNEPKKPPTVGPTRKKPAGPKQYPKDRYPGFRFDRRLNQKQQAFQKLTWLIYLHFWGMV